jgi:hypothetical protein
MRKFSFLILAFVAVLFSSCNQNQEGLNSDLISNPNSASGNDEQQGAPILKFKNTEHDFGKIVDGVKVSYTFKFKNTGTADLIIHQVKSSCGCTATKFTEDAVPPGGEGRVQLTFDGTNRRGFNNKTATVITNTQPSTHILKITAMVVGVDEI